MVMPNQSRHNFLLNWPHATPDSAWGMLAAMHMEVGE